jgi:hypothetical protein
MCCICAVKVSFTQCEGDFHSTCMASPKSLEGHLPSNLFWWHIYHHHQGGREFTLKAGVPLVRYSPCYAHIVRATAQELWRRLSQHMYSAGCAIWISKTQFNLWSILVLCWNTYLKHASYWHQSSSFKTVFQKSSWIQECAIILFCLIMSETLCS